MAFFKKKKKGFVQRSAFRSLWEKRSHLSVRARHQLKCVCTVGGGISVHLSDLHHGAAGHGGRARPFGAPAQLDWVVHHNIPLEQDGGGHERVALSAETHGAHSVYFMQGGQEGRANGLAERETKQSRLFMVAKKKEEEGKKNSPILHCCLEY